MEEAEATSVSAEDFAVGLCLPAKVRTASAEVFATRIRLRAATYFADLDPDRTVVRLLRAGSTSNSQLFEFQVTDGLSNHHVIAKIPFSARRLRLSHNQRQRQRPRLFPVSETQVKGLHEFLALAATYDYFARLNDPRFGAIRPLDVFGEPCCLIMEKVEDPRLQVAWHQFNRIKGRLKGRSLESAMSNAGAWLRNFHELPLLPHTSDCKTRRHEIIAGIENFTDYLAKQTPEGPFLKELCHKLVAVSHHLLPDFLPLGLTHRDFAPRNVLMGSQGRITVLDTQGSWRAPIYVDLAYFLVALKVSAPQICGAGWYHDPLTLAAYEQDFLQGYFAGDPAPIGAIRVFESLLLLEWWAQLVHAHRKAKGVRRAIRRGQLLGCSRYLKRYLRKMMDQIDGCLD